MNKTKGKSADRWTIIKLLSWTESYFKDHAIDSPRLTGEILLAKILGIRRLDLYLQHDRPLEKKELTQFKSLIKRRILHEPVAYITGEKGFYEADFKVGQGVLIPRPDTEILVETAMDRLKPFDSKSCRILELGTGSGAIVVSLALACPEHKYFACDISSLALATARTNVQKICATPVGLFQGSWLDAVAPGAGFHLILSNPPYIPRADIEKLAPEIRDHEPRLALDGGPDGLDSIRQILAQASDCLVPGGQVILEMGYDQKKAVANIAADCAWVNDVQFIKDLAGHNRLVVLKKID